MSEIWFLFACRSILSVFSVTKRFCKEVKSPLIYKTDSFGLTIYVNWIGMAVSFIKGAKIQKNPFETPGNYYVASCLAEWP